MRPDRRLAGSHIIRIGAAMWFVVRRLVLCLDKDEKQAPKILKVLSA